MNADQFTPAFEQYFQIGLSLCMMFLLINLRRLHDAHKQSYIKRKAV